ncbi:MAG: UDP-N-acetylglucosamine-1-phosphate transferase [Methanoregula sp.]|jgi:UDP-N-acetylglucosamine--dolichyl-phosphate N-acetylglucosaminephosphotransferase
MVFSFPPGPEDYLYSMLIIFFLVPFLIMMIAMPYIIPKLKEKGHFVRDMYKKGFPEVPVNGGLILLLFAIFSLSILTLFYGKIITPINFTIIVVVALFALYGMLDDMVNIGRPAKLILLYYCAYPLIPFITTSVLILPFIGEVDLSLIYLQIVIPTYVPVVANLVNMHSGFNGLAPGLSLILLSTLLLKTFLYGNIYNALFIICLTGALLAYFFFENYPARILWGNLGALSVGAAIGALIVTQGFVVSGFIMFIPHTVNFLMYVYWRLNLRKYPLTKFGRIRNDGTLDVPNPLTLKWVLPYYFRMTERQGAYAMYGLTALFCVIGFYYPG